MPLVAVLRGKGPTNSTDTLVDCLFHTGLTLCCALHEFVIGLVVLWTDMVAPPVELVQAWPAPLTCLTVHTRLTLCRAHCKDKSTVMHIYVPA